MRVEGRIPVTIALPKEKKKITVGVTGSRITVFQLGIYHFPELWLRHRQPLCKAGVQEAQKQAMKSSSKASWKRALDLKNPERSIFPGIIFKLDDGLSHWTKKLLPRQVFWALCLPRDMQLELSLVISIPKMVLFNFTQNQNHLRVLIKSQSSWVQPRMETFFLTSSPGDSDVGLSRTHLATLQII